ncbi:MAG: ABC transporter [Planctomycetes bacterium]|uniref:TrlF family AAA-like ATPase n=1 Tax=Candidatus Wunengus sp. YC65 TaxID=3367701 RepID=UPI001DAAE22B|nr:ABC transporter [Planctomycetota bacterium]
MSTYNPYLRGAEWRKWDLHVHTPASFHWKGTHFRKMSSTEKAKVIDEMINALNDADPAVFALMDYWTFDGWFALNKRRKETGSPVLKKTVFPGIELRLVSPTKCRLNAHVIFSNEIPDQALHDFRSSLEVDLILRPLSEECLIALARNKIGSDKLEIHSFKKEEVDSDDEVALLAGSTVAEIRPESYKEAIAKVPNSQAIGFMPYDTTAGLERVDWKQHYSFFLSLLKSSPIFETRNIDLRGAFVGERTPGNAKWFENLQSDLDNIPRLAVAGSDAHRFSDYGKFPSGKATWIKADPTFLGLLQAIKEPAKRSYIGECPQKLIEVAENKTYFIDSVGVDKNQGSPITDHWLSNCNLVLNPDLVAIIGNKGSGKSALADIIALLGNSRQKDHFSFLSPNRFCKKPRELAKHFTGTIKWRDQTTTKRGLFDNPPVEAVELVRYIPQAHFEKLCNEHVSGRSDVFEKELRAVIFSHTSASIRQKALDFDQLIEQQESIYRDQLGEYRKDLKKLNQEIEGNEAQLQPEIKRSLEELLTLKQKQIEEHKKIVPKAEPKPSEQLTPEQQQASGELERIAGLLKAIGEKSQTSIAKEAQLAAKATALQAVRDRLRLLQRQYKQFQDETAEDLKILGLDISLVASLTTSEEVLEQLVVSVPQEQKFLLETVAQNEQEKQKLLTEQSTFKGKLNEPQQRYEQSLKACEVWEEKLRELTGAPNAPETLEGIKARIAQLDQLPTLLNDKQSRRLILSAEIFDILDAQRKAREELFKPVQEVIQGNSLIRDEYKLQFQAALGGSSDALASKLFELIKQNSGEFRGEDESYTTVRDIAEQFDLNKKQDALKFVSELHEKIVAAAKGNNKGAIGLTSLLRVNKTSSDVYDLLFGLPFLEPRYSLLFQDTQIEQLSPGQRGALLLIFYLLVDKWRNPIILDQPEENLDNETVVRLLVPVLSEAKKRRQIIMVTHNPNLAVVCDAEQVIYSSFDRKKASKIEYVSGSIENPTINSHVVNVLEGTKPAFDNRRIKYH